MLKETGLIALITVLIIAFVTLFVTISANLLNIGQTQIVLKEEKTAKSLYMASSCAEHALLQLRTDFNATSSGNLTINGESCIFDIEAVDPNRIIKAEAQVEAKIRRLRVEVRKPLADLVIDSWEEVADF